MKPVILITCKPAATEWAVGGDCRTPANYCEAIIRAGGIPVISALGDADQYAQLADGILFTGSSFDVTPALYGEENRKAQGCNEALDDMELKLFQAFYDRKKPIMGICRGIQIINVALGGTLVQDIPSEVPDLTVHDQVYQKKTEFHPVNAIDGSLLAALFGTEFMTNSYHHQAVKNCGDGLLATVTTKDGVIEAIEHETLPVFGVQWHPERNIGDEQQALPDMLPLFRHFIALCSE